MTLFNYYLNLYYNLVYIISTAKFSYLTVKNCSQFWIRASTMGRRMRWMMHPPPLSPPLQHHGLSTHYSPRRIDRPRTMARRMHPPAYPPLHCWGYGGWAGQCTHFLFIFFVFSSICISLFFYFILHLSLHSLPHLNFTLNSITNSEDFHICKHKI